MVLRYVTNMKSQLTSMIKKRHVTNTGSQLTSMIKKRYVTNTVPQLTSMIKKPLRHQPGAPTDLYD